MSKNHLHHTKSMTVQSPQKVAVIGAGVAGLVTARALKSDGIQVVIYEKSNQLGGLWAYNPQVESDPLGQDPEREIVHGSLYPSLRTNLPRQLLGFSDYPFVTKQNRDPRTFPGHEEVLQFLIEFSEEFDLVELIRFNTEVIRIDRVGLGNEDWVIKSRNGGLELEEVFDAVVVCNGHHTQPRVPHLQGIEKWPGKQLHSHNYRGPESFHDKIVLCIGLGASAIDIAKEICGVAKEVRLSSRSKPTFKLDYGSISNIWCHTEVDSVRENGEVSFKDGSSITPDVILYCTGYEYKFPFLKADGIVTVDDNRVGPLYKHIFPPKVAPKLAFVGLVYQSIVFLTLELQARWVSHILSGNGSLPSEEDMLVDVEQHYMNMKLKGIPKHHTHRIGFENVDDYRNWLANDGGFEGVGEEIKLAVKEFFGFAYEIGFFRAKEWEPV